jgi:hypothetical protein
LQGPGQVRLARFARIDASSLTAALDAAERCDVAAWRAALAELKQTVAVRSEYPVMLREKFAQANIFAA